MIFTEEDRQNTKIDKAKLGKTKRTKSKESV
jgi:hypothetical protein